MMADQNALVIYGKETTHLFQKKTVSILYTYFHKSQNPYHKIGGEYKE